MTLPLDKITILDLSRMLPGPYCTMILSDLGVEVIRVEDPNYPYSNLPPFFQKGKTPPQIRTLAPKQGQNTEEVLKSLNYSDEDIKNLRKNKVV